ncbi:MAG: glycosyltransferase family 2 protein [Planctomycetota bacterium]|jgi:GT2 family glycosyltransferase
MHQHALISFVLATHNRREITLNTLGRVFATGRPSGDFEVIVVDNASADGSAQAIRAAFPQIKLLAERRNLGSCAKALGVDHARGRYLVFLDDDSYPRAGSIDRMNEHFAADPRLAAAGFRVHLPDGRQECSALPNVFIGCGVGLRADALRQVGGLDRSFFMQAEEYDLSFRLVNAGWRIRTFDDLHVEHLKTPCARRSGRTVYYDTKNNLTIAARYLPASYYALYRQDWLQRYAWLAVGDERIAAFVRGAVAGSWRALKDRVRYTDRRLTPAAFETLFCIDFITERTRRLADTGIRRIVLADLGKNVLAFYRAATESAIRVTAIGDDRFAGEGRRYRGVPILPLDAALQESHPDAVVVSNTSLVHAARTRDRVSQHFHGPVHCWFAAAPCDAPIAAPRPAPLAGVCE